MKKMGFELGIAPIAMLEMIKEIDVNNDGTIELNEWLDYIKKCKKHNETQTRTKQNVLLDIIDEKKGNS